MAREKGIEHGFEQHDDGGELRRRKLVDQLVRLLFVVRGSMCHKNKSSEIYCAALGSDNPVVVQFGFPQASIRPRPVGNCRHGKRTHTSYSESRSSGLPVYGLRSQI